jgi:hypothetical protein
MTPFPNDWKKNKKTCISWVTTITGMCNTIIKTDIPGFQILGGWFYDKCSCFCKKKLEDIKA